MAILALASAPFMLLMSRFMIKKQREYSQKTREMSSKLMTFEVEAFYNFDTIKSFGIAPHYSRLMRWWQGKFKDTPTTTSISPWPWSCSALPPSLAR